MDTPAARDGLALLAFLADPKDDLALLTLLRSPYFAVPDAVLHSAAEIRQDSSWWESLQYTESFARPREILGSLLRNRYRLLPSFLLQEADLATGYTAVLAHLPGAERRLADYGAFLDLVRTLEGSGETLSGVVSRIKTLMVRGLEIPRPPLGGLEAVQLMTVHAAKGLEWRVVFLVAMDRLPWALEPLVLFHPDRGLAFRWGGEKQGGLYTTLFHEHLRAQEEEEARLLYVALTRARDKLVLSRARSARESQLSLNKQKSYQQVFVEGFPKVPSFATLVEQGWTEVGSLPGVSLEEADPGDF